MKCNIVNKNLIAYLEDALDSSKRQKIEEHLSSCKRCIVIFEQVKNTYALLDEKEEAAVNPFFFTRLEQKIENIERGNIPFYRTIYFRLLKPALLTLLVLLSIISGVLIGSQFTNQASAISSYESELDYYMESVYFQGVANEPIESYLLNQNEE